MTKPVQLSDDAYARLAAEKRPGESFSDVVLRLTQKRISLAEALRTSRTQREITEHRRFLKRVDEMDRKDAERWARQTRGRRA